MHGRLPLLLALACVAVTCTALAADWPQFRGPNADGIAPDTGLNKDWAQKPPKVLWRLPLGDGGYAGPSVAKGLVYVIDHEGKQDIVRALKLDTGEEVWRFAYDDTDRNNYGFSRSTPVYSEGMLYTISRMGWVHCLKADTGEKVWAKNLIADFRGKKPQWDYSMSAAIDGDRLVLMPGGDGGSLLVLNKATGDKILSGGNNDVPGYSTPTVATIDGRKQYLLFTAANAIGCDAADGKLLWSYPWKTSYDVNAAQLMVIGSYVFLTSGYKHGCALLKVGPEGATAVWSNTEIQAQFNSPVVYKGYLYAITDPGDMVCVNPQDGSCVWRQKGFEKGGLIVADGCLIGMNGKAGDLVMAKAVPDGYQELSRLVPLGGQSWTAPVLSDGRLIVRNTKEIACLDLR